MSDDTATVERLNLLLAELGRQRVALVQYGDIPTDRVDNAIAVITEAAGLIEQQARTIAEQAARLEAMERDAGRWQKFRAARKDKAAFGSRFIRMGIGAFSYEIPGGDELDAAIDGAKT